VESHCTQGQTKLQDIGQASILLLLVFLSRYFTRGPVYYVDGPILVQCIRDHTYVIQPPGYWLFARMGGLFSDPAFGLRFMNEVFSAAGVAIFFLLCRKFELDRRMAWAASICYASIFFVWLAGDIHSSYATQVLFAPLLAYLFLCYRDRSSILRLVACGVCFAAGAGLRPSDGAFLAPLFAFLALQFVQGGRRKILLGAITAALCLAWYIPGQAAARTAHIVTMGRYIDIVRPMSLLLSGIEPRAIGNTVRVVLPLLVAFGILGPALPLKRGSFENRMIALWITPGMLFFFFFYMADPVYFTYLTAAVVLLAALSRQRSRAIILLMSCAAFNISLFFFARPLRRDNRIDQALNFYVVKYCDYGITHQWTSTIGRGGHIP
jgi:4-amino-4-deoxy-L-arabinose transferase-like glycosyltransferase